MKKKTLTLLLIFAVTVLATGCGYSLSEKKQMKAYQKQAEKNAVSYMSEKYGLDADVTGTRCEKSDPGPIPDFWPDPTGNVYVTMNDGKKAFTVYISGEEETTDGIDNYQYEEITDAFAQKLYEVTELDAEDVYLCFGTETEVNGKKKGMIVAYFDGNNLAEIFADEDAKFVVSYVEQDVSDIDVDTVQSRCGVENGLFVNYDSMKHYKTIRNLHYNVHGWPIENGIDDNLPYISGYYVMGGDESSYHRCKQTVVDGIILIPEGTMGQLDLVRTDLDEASNWNGYGAVRAKQIAQAYALDTDASVVDVYIPVKLLRVKDSSKVVIGMQYDAEGERCYKILNPNLSDDGVYVHAKVYTRDYSDICFAAFIDQEENK